MLEQYSLLVLMQNWLVSRKCKQVNNLSRRVLINEHDAIPYSGNWRQISELYDRCYYYSVADMRLILHFHGGQ
jgi:hypothetical protein